MPMLWHKTYVPVPMDTRPWIFHDSFGSYVADGFRMRWVTTYIWKMEGSDANA